MQVSGIKMSETSQAFSFFSMFCLEKEKFPDTVVCIIVIVVRRILSSDKECIPMSY